MIAQAQSERRSGVSVIPTSSVDASALTSKLDSQLETSVSSNVLATAIAINAPANSALATASVNGEVSLWTIRESTKATTAAPTAAPEDSSSQFYETAIFMIAIIATGGVILCGVVGTISWRMTRGNRASSKLAESDLVDVELPGQLPQGSVIAARVSESATSIATQALHNSDGCTVRTSFDSPAHFNDLGVEVHLPAPALVRQTDVQLM